MPYHFFTYSILFLPVVAMIYQILPKKNRWLFMLLVNYTFFILLSKWLIIYLLGATAIAYIIAYRIDCLNSNQGLKGKELAKAKKKYLIIGIVINIFALVMLKYLKVFGIGLNWLVPVGISYYTLQVISYMTDIYHAAIPFEKNPARLALYLSFFPQIMEGPISRYSEVACDLYQGKPITYRNLTRGYQRIMWGLFKKMLIADRLGPMVSRIFDRYAEMSGSVVLIGAIAFTIQLYMEFSGCMDIILGSGEIFGIKLPENFRQPFFAKDASEFWRRWHITLGTWLKDYVFYPVSLSKIVRKITKFTKNNIGKEFSKTIGPLCALFCVWLCNGIWHGPKSNYLFYGMYYFLIITLELLLKSPVDNLLLKLKTTRNNMLFIILQRIKLLFVVIIGEMFFRASSVYDGFVMFTKIFTDFNPSSIKYTNLIIDGYDFACVYIFSIIVLIVDILKEKNIDLREKISQIKAPIRWALWYLCIILLLVFGAYGKGYSMIDMIYAAY